MDGAILKIVTRWDNIYKYDVHVENSSAGIQLKSGYAVYILRELSWMLNFSFTICPTIGTFEFEKAEEFGVDLFVASYSLTKSRAEIVDPTFVIGSSKIIALMNHNFEEGVGFSFLQPFQFSLWIAVFFLGIVLLASFVLFGYFEKYTRMELLFHGIALLLQKSTTDVKFAHTSAQTLSWTTLIITLILSSYYGGSLISLLTVQRYEIDSLDALLRSKYKILLERGYNTGSPVQAILENLTKEPLANLLLEKAKTSGFFFNDFEEGIKIVGCSAVSHVLDEETAFGAVESMPCSWSMIPVLAIKYPWSMFVRKNVHFRKHINAGLLRLDESGFLSRAKHNYIPRRRECSPRTASQPEDIKESIAMTHVFSAFKMYGGGIIISFMILCCHEKNMIRFYFSNGRKSTRLLLLTKTLIK